jgi:sortase A
MDVRTPQVATETPTPPPGAAGAGWHRYLRWFGIACLLGASFFAGYVAWLMWGTGVETARAQEGFRTDIARDWPANPTTDPAAEPDPVVPGDAYAILQIPSVGIDFVVVQGTGYEDLKLGPGHYTDTADPWDGTGRVGIAGHRTTYQAPFNALGEVEAGDTITVITEVGSFDYRVNRTFVIPADGSGYVLDQTKQPTLVLTTCHPKYSSSQRLIVEAELIRAPDSEA